MKTPSTKTLKMTDEMMLALIYGKKLSFIEDGFKVELVPPHYVRPEERVLRAFDEGVACEKERSKFSNMFFNNNQP
jgi:hypothetical protein